MISSLWILNARGAALAFRDYRGDVPSSARQMFVTQIIDNELENTQGYVTPIFQVKGVVFCYKSFSEMYLVAASGSDANCFTMIEFLNQLERVVQSYFGTKITESTITHNQTIIYELLDEVVDFGYPQTLEPDILKTYIQQKSILDYIREFANFGPKEKEVNAPTAVTGTVSWRKEGIKYSKNEYFLDVTERQDLTITQEGKVLSNVIRGAFKCCSYLTGMPELRLGLNDRVRFDKALGVSGNYGAGAEAAAGGADLQSTGIFNNKADTESTELIDLEDVKMHQCVRLHRFETERSITFIPPDQKFDLLSYRISSATTKPLISCSIKEIADRGSTTYMLKLETGFPNHLSAKLITVLVPVPLDADTPSFRPSHGVCKYMPADSVFEWRLKAVEGKTSCSLQSHFGLPTLRVMSEEVMAYIKKPIVVQYEIPYYSLSGIQVRYLKIHDKSGYEANPWVRYLSSGIITIKRQ